MDSNASPREVMYMSPFCSHAGSYAPPHALSTRSSLSTDTEPRPDESDQSASVSTLKQYRRGRNPHIAVSVQIYCVWKGLLKRL